MRTAVWPHKITYVSVGELGVLADCACGWSSGLPEGTERPTHDDAVDAAVRHLRTHKAVRVLLDGGSS